MALNFDFIDEGNHTSLLVHKEIDIDTVNVGTDVDDTDDVNDIRDMAESIHSYCIKNHKNNVCFDIVSDSLMFNKLNLIDKIVRYLIKTYSYQKQQFFYLFGAMPDIANIVYYNKVCDHFNWLELSTMFINIWEEVVRTKTNNDLEFYDNFNNEIKIKSKKFTCYNRNIKPHRLMLCAEMIKRNLIDKAYYSMYLPKDDGQGCYADKLAAYGHLPQYFPNLHQQITNMYNQNSYLFPISLGLSGDASIDTERSHRIINDDRKHWEDAYFMVVTETKFFHDSYNDIDSLRNELTLESYLISEKTFKCIQGKMPFIVASLTGTLECLRRFGYKTFHPYINESYDKIENDEDRLLAIANEIERLCSLSDEQFLDWQNHIRPIVQHNYNLLKKPRNLILKNFI